MHLSLVFQAAPWSAALTDKVQDMEARMKTVDELQTRATRAEEERDRLQKEVETLTGQSITLAEDKRRLEEDQAVLHRQVERRNQALKLSRKQEWKTKKLLFLTEERYFQMFFDDAVVRAHDLGWNYKQLLDEGVSDLVSREDADVPHVVSSGEDEDLSS